MTNIEHPASPIDTPAKVIEPTPGPDVAAIVEEHQGDVTSPTGILPDGTPIAWGASAKDTETSKLPYPELPADHLLNLHGFNAGVICRDHDLADVDVTIQKGRHAIFIINGGLSAIEIDTTEDDDPTSIVFTAGCPGGDVSQLNVEVYYTDNQHAEPPNRDDDPIQQGRERLTKGHEWTEITHDKTTIIYFLYTPTQPKRIQPDEPQTPRSHTDRGTV